MPIITLLIVDIDNTLFDWFDFWYHSFSAMIEAILKCAPLERRLLLNEIRDVHRRHGTTEYTWLLQELPSVLALPEPLQAEVIKAGRGAYRDVRERTSRLYENVYSTLREVKNSGSRVVGFTESQVFYTVQRLKRFKLDGVLDALYCREEHRTPVDVNLETLRSKPAHAYVLKNTRIVTLATHNRKPDPRILLRIASDFGAAPDNVLYVGDSKMKDIYMAQQAGVHDAYAEYGQSMNKEGYDLLRSVSSWTDEEIATEKIMALEVKPSVVLKNGLAEILQHFTFSGPEQINVTGQHSERLRQLD